MKRTVFTLALFITCLFSVAQVDLHNKIIHYLKIYHPEIPTENKLIAVNFWSIDNTASREANKSFEKVYSTFEIAKLKGGVNGIIVISISKDNLSTEATIAMTRDAVKKLVKGKAEEFEGLEWTSSNLIFDSNGKVLYKDLAPENIFTTVQQLITR
jgi:hypothetical protein